jgi:hypothetical protein
VLESQTIVPRPAAPPPGPVRDPDDAWVLASAVAGAADLLATGDTDLLNAAPQSPLPILTRRAFWGPRHGAVKARPVGYPGAEITSRALRLMARPLCRLPSALAIAFRVRRALVLPLGWRVPTVRIGHASTRTADSAMASAERPADRRRTPLRSERP